MEHERTYRCKTEAADVIAEQQSERTGRERYSVESDVLTLSWGGVTAAEGGGFGSTPWF